MLYRTVKQTMPISRLSVIRITITSILVGLVALLAIVAVNLWLVHRAAVYADAVTNASSIHANIVDLRDFLVNAETGQRGYLLTGLPDYLVPYTAARSAIADKLTQLRAQLGAFPRQKAEVDKLTGLVTDKLAELQGTIDLAKSGQRDEALAAVKTGRGKQLMDDAREVLGGMLDRSEARIDRAVHDQDNSITDLEWVTLIGAAVILLVVGGSVWTLIVYTRQLVAAQREVTALNAGLKSGSNSAPPISAAPTRRSSASPISSRHDLRAPLVNIMGFTSRARNRLDRDQDAISNGRPADANDAQRSAGAAALEDLPEAIGFIRVLDQQDGPADQRHPEAVARGPPRRCSPSRSSWAACSTTAADEHAAPASPKPAANVEIDAHVAPTWSPTGWRSSRSSATCSTTR